MSEQKKAIDMTPEELNEWLTSLPAPEDDMPFPYGSAPDPYLKHEPLSPDRVPREIRFDDNGNLHTQNISAYRIPELTITEEIGGTLYTVTGSYEGAESFLRKLERISAKKFTKNMEVDE